MVPFVSIHHKCVSVTTSDGNASRFVRVTQVITEAALTHYICVESYLEAHDYLLY